MSRYLPTRLYIFLISSADTKDIAAHAHYQYNPNKSAGDMLFFGSGHIASSLKRHMCFPIRLHWL